MLKCKIQDTEFVVRKLDIFEANDLDRTILEILPDMLEGLDGVIKDGDTFMDIDLGALGRVMRTAFDRMPRDTFKSLCMRMFVCVSYVVNDKEIPMTSEQAINACGLRVSGLYRLLWAVMEENGFLPFDLLVFGGVMEKIRAFLEALKGSNNSSEELDESES